MYVRSICDWSRVTFAVYRSCFFFNDTATTEIYTYDTLFPYTTLFRSSEIVIANAYFFPSYGFLRELRRAARSEEHTSELQSLMRISYAVFCLKKKITS